jgi:hypothetical protein
MFIFFATAMYRARTHAACCFEGGPGTVTFQFLNFLQAHGRPTVHRPRLARHTQGGAAPVPKPFVSVVSLGELSRRRTQAVAHTRSHSPKAPSARCACAAGGGDCPLPPPKWQAALPMPTHLLHWMTQGGAVGASAVSVSKKETLA